MLGMSWRHLGSSRRHVLHVIVCAVARASLATRQSSQCTPSPTRRRPSDPGVNSDSGSVGFRIRSSGCTRASNITRFLAADADGFKGCSSSQLILLGRTASKLLRIRLGVIFWQRPVWRCRRSNAKPLFHDGFAGLTCRRGCTNECNLTGSHDRRGSGTRVRDGNPPIYLRHISQLV